MPFKECGQIHSSKGKNLRQTYGGTRYYIYKAVTVDLVFMEILISPGQAKNEYYKYQTRIMAESDICEK